MSLICFFKPWQAGRFYVVYSQLQRESCRNRDAGYGREDSVYSLLVHGEALRKFDLLSTDMKNTETLNVDYYIRGLALYFPL